MLMALSDYGNKGKKSIPFLNSIYLSRRAWVFKLIPFVGTWSKGVRSFAQR